MKMSKCFLFLLFLVLVPSTCLRAEESSGPPEQKRSASPAIVVADFDFCGLGREHMVEYVGYLAVQIQEAVVGAEVVREPAKGGARAGKGPDGLPFSLRVAGTLRRSGRNFTVTIRLATAGPFPRQATLDYEYQSIGELYSGCRGAAEDIVDWFTAPPSKETEVGTTTWALGMKTELGWMSATATAPAGLSATILFTTWVWAMEPLLPPLGLDLVWTRNITAGTAAWLVGFEVNVSLILVSAGLSFVWENAPQGQVPYLGIRLRFLDIPPVLLAGFGHFEKSPLVDAGLDVLPLTIRWNLKTGKPVLTIGLASISLGHSFW